MFDYYLFYLFEQTILLTSEACHVFNVNYFRRLFSKGKPWIHSFLTSRVSLSDLADSNFGFRYILMSSYACRELESWWPLSVASTLPFGDHRDISLCRLNEKKGFGWLFQMLLCVYLQCGIWKCIWKLPDTELFSVVYTLRVPQHNSFKLKTKQKANQVPGSSGFVLNIFLKAEVNWAILRWSYGYMCVLQPVFSKQENWRAASWFFCWKVKLECISITVMCKARCATRNILDVSQHFCVALPQS